MLFHLILKQTIQHHAVVLATKVSLVNGETQSNQQPGGLLLYSQVTYLVYYDCIAFPELNKGTETSITSQKIT